MTATQAKRQDISQCYHADPVGGLGPWFVGGFKPGDMSQRGDFSLVRQRVACADRDLLSGRRQINAQSLRYTLR